MTMFSRKVSALTKDGSPKLLDQNIVRSGQVRRRRFVLHGFCGLRLFRLKRMNAEPDARRPRRRSEGAAGGTRRGAQHHRRPARHLTKIDLAAIPG
ncbi:hypothetical protein MPLB_1640018 [Mesorhizobium sp. ORS 3324]|nr:hypothetical protein MPLB_1640018 [Mesorhizobium sp. ORS 3324]